MARRPKVIKSSETPVADPVENFFLDPSATKSIATIQARIPQVLLSKFENKETENLYQSILTRLVEDTLPEGSTILQILVAERAAYYWAQAHELEQAAPAGTDSETPAARATEDYRFYIAEFNSNLRILRELAMRNLPAQQMKLLAKKTISVIDRVISDPTAKDAIIKEIIHEFTVEVPVVLSGSNGGNGQRVNSPAYT